MTARPSPRIVVFYSTNRAWAWGAPDYVWPMAARHFIEQGRHVVAVIHPDADQRPEIADLRARGAEIRLLPPLHYSGGRLNTLRNHLAALHPTTRRLAAIARQDAPAHVFINQAGSHDLLHEQALLPHLQPAGPFTYDLFFRSNQYGAPFDQARREHAQKLLGAARSCQFNSAWTRSLVELQVLQRLSNAAIFPHVVRFPYEEPLPWPADETLRFASVSRYDTAHKGLDVLLQALALLPSDAPRWRFDFYGHGPEREYLEKLAVWLRLDERVRFHPGRDDIPSIWRDHHALVLTSRYEGLSVAMLEAMACGRPVLRTPYGGCDEWLIPDETGLLIPAPEPALIARTLLEALHRREALPAMGLAAHARLRARLPRDPWAVYLRALENHPA